MNDDRFTVRSGTSEAFRETARSRRVALLLPDMGGGGAERVALTLAEYFVAAGHEVDLVLMRAEGALLAALPAGIHLVDLGTSRIRSAIPAFARYLKERQPQAVQVSMWPLTIAAIVARALAGSSTRIVTSDHTILSKQYPRSRPLIHAFLKWSVRLLYPRAEARVMVANEAADDLARLSGLDRSAIEVIYNPVAGPPANLQPRPDIDRLWGDAETRIITVGSLKGEKNHPLLVRAFARAFRGPRARLMIVGEGPLREQLEQTIEAEDVREQVVLPGFTSDPWPFYASADLFVMSSDFEGYPLVLVEALRSGLRIVSTDCRSGPREILDGGRFGTLVPVGDEAALADAMRARLAEPIDRAALQAQAEALSGRQTCERYLRLMLDAVPA
ncbi:glycosyltransferase [Sphingomonas parva]|uniref:Glycosyltransferase n=1 Tax=Sphingomonas parva TaxID=2555898 RepID=A0A4Y8ZV39_9SPHN|nr:glycosyltransferase [Sphingomonas parva]